MAEPKVIKHKEIAWEPIKFGGAKGDAGEWIILLGPNGQFKDVSKGMIMGICLVNPGYAAHR